MAYVRITDSGQLKIIGTQELDAGEYRCEAVNDAGTDSALIRLEVGCKLRGMDSPPWFSDLGILSQCHR